MVIPEKSAQQTPATVFSGFLGSGKTTIISHLVDKLQASGQQIVYIKNEIGDEDLDAKIISGKNIKTKELLNGCICCTLVGSFASSINEIVDKFHPDRIIIEASGAADPSALAMMISSHPKLYRDGVIGVIDVANFEGYKDISITAQNQAKFTDLLIFNKVELVDLAQKQAVVGYVRELNNHSPIAEAPHGKIDPELVFGISSSELTRLLKDYHQPEEIKHHLEHDELSGLSFQLPEISKVELEKKLEQLPKQVFRAKGVLKDNQQSLVFNKVGERIDWQMLPTVSEVNNSFIILIGYHLKSIESELESSFKK